MGLKLLAESVNKTVVERKILNKHIYLSNKQAWGFLFLIRLYSSVKNLDL